MIDKTKIIGEKSGRIAFLGNLSQKKGIELLVHSFFEIHRNFPNFTLHIGGETQEMRTALFLDHAIIDMGLQQVIEYYGKINDVNDFFSHMTWIINSSPVEASPVGILEALSQGLSPLIYSFYGAKGQYPDSYIWKSIPELIEMIKKGPQDPEKIKQFVKDNYSLQKQLNSIDEVIDNLIKKPKKDKKNLLKEGTVSAVIAVKNGAKTIERAINSLQKQTRPLRRIIIVNDGSTDNTLQVVEKASAKSEVICEVISLEPSRWVFNARNEGFKMVSQYNGYFFFLDSDDWVEENYVEEMSKVLDNNPTIDIVYPDLIYFDENDRKETFNVPDFNVQQLVQHNFIAYAAMQRTKKFKEIGGYSEYLNDSRNHMTEWDLWLRYLKVGAGFKRLPKPLFHYFKSGNSTQMSGNYEVARECQHLQLALGITGNYNIQMSNKERILLVCQGKDYCDHSKVGFELMTIAKPLEMDGQYEVYVFQYDVEMNYFGRDGMIDRLKKFVELIDPKYIFHFSYKDAIPVEIWKDISERWNTIVFHSDEWRYDEFCREYEKGFKSAVTTYPSVYEQMEHPGRILSQWAANKFYFKPNENRDIDVSFCGQAHTNRKELFDNSNVECYGLGWRNGFVDFPEVGKILGKSKISIAPSMGVKGRQLKLRPFEITASGALCLCESMPGIEKYFIPDKEIVLFDTKQEMDEKIEYYLEHDEDREAIAKAGHERTVREHYWEHRLAEIFEEINKRNK